MANPFHPHPFAEQYQQNAYNGFPFLPEFGHRRSAPREEPFIHWRPSERSWYQGGRKLHGFKSKKYFARPVDGARRGTWGRLKDAMSGEGPDVFVVANGDRRTLMREMPGREHWSGWDSTGLGWMRRGLGAVEDMDWYPPGNFNDPVWARRDPGEVYNFRTRRWGDLKPGNKWKFWSDAHWPRGQRGEKGVPTCWRSWDGEWKTTVDGSAGRWAGGRPLR